MAKSINLELRSNKSITSTVEKNISGTVNSTCNDSEFGKCLTAWRNGRRPKVPSIGGGGVKQGED